MRKTLQTSITSLLLSFTVFALFCLGCSKQETPSYSGTPTKITISTTKNESSTILYTAHHLDFFRLLPSGNGGISREQ